METNFSLDYEAYENEYKLENMYFGVSDKIKLLDIYKEVKKIKMDNEMRYIPWNKYYYLRIIIQIGNFYFFLQIVKTKDPSEKYLFSKILFVNPIKLYLPNEDHIDIVSAEQFANINDKNKQYEIYLYCKKENKDEQFLITHLLKHLKCNDKIYAYSKKDEKYLLEQDFGKNFKTFPQNCKFESPYEFDKHYSDYTNHQNE